MAKVYINIKENGKVETLDEFETYKEAKKCWKNIDWLIVIIMVLILVLDAQKIGKRDKNMTERKLINQTKKLVDD